MTMLSAGAEPVSTQRELGAQPEVPVRFFPCAVCPRRFGLAAAAALIAVGVLFAAMAVTLDFGSLSLPGPGFVPLFLGIGLVGVGAAIMHETWNAPPADGAVDVGHTPVAIVCLLLLVLSFTFEPLGAYLSLGVFVTAFLVLIAKVRPVTAAIAAAIAVGAVWLFFHKALGVQLPTLHW